MAKWEFDDGRSLGDYSKPYYVAEVNTSHYGKVDVAKEMIDAAKSSGCDCVKFQSWSADSLYSKTYYDENPFAKRMVSRFAFNKQQLKELAEYCNKVGIAFSSTPYSEEEVDFLIDECEAPYIKIASMDLDNDRFLRYIAGKGAPIVLSTGMSTMDEIEHAVHLLREAQVERLCLLHCISVYPPERKDIRLKNILGLRDKYPDIPVGFSDHSIGPEMSIAAVAMGSAMIEKHLTLDRSKIGMDNQMATEPQEMKEMIECCNHVFEAMGDEKRILSEQEQEQKTKMRRSLIALEDIPEGTILTAEMVGAKRPATGISLSRIKDIIGRKVNRTIEKDTVIYEKDIIW